MRGFSAFGSPTPKLYFMQGSAPASLVYKSTSCVVVSSCSGGLPLTLSHSFTSCRALYSSGSAPHPPLIPTCAGVAASLYNMLHKLQKTFGVVFWRHGGDCVLGMEEGFEETFTLLLPIVQCQNIDDSNVVH
uniref:Leucine--tRNA ligase n=1 Tax=Lygus hesperus TaxID=30085 RepID=A0A0A9YG38_LYGHE